MTCRRVDAPSDPLGFAQLLISLLDEGRRTATYKLLADRRCNNAKRDNLAALPLLERWALRRPDVLASFADEARWPLRSDESMRVARGIYSHQPFGAQLWTAPGVYELMDRARLTQLLPLLETP